MSLPGPTSRVAVTTQGHPLLERTPPAVSTPSSWSRTPTGTLRPCRIWPLVKVSPNGWGQCGVTGGDTVSGMVPGLQWSLSITHELDGLSSEVMAGQAAPTPGHEVTSCPHGLAGCHQPRRAQVGTHGCCTPAVGVEGACVCVCRATSANMGVFACLCDCIHVCAHVCVQRWVCTHTCSSMQMFACAAMCEQLLHTPPRVYAHVQSST